MQLTVTTFVSVDGVYQGLGGPDEDRRGGWLMPHFDDATGQFIDSVFERVDAFLLVEFDTYTFLKTWANRRAIAACPSFSRSRIEMRWSALARKVAPAKGSIGSQS